MKRWLGGLIRNRAIIGRAAAITVVTALAAAAIALLLALGCAIPIALVWGIDYFRVVGTIALVAWAILFIVGMCTQWYWPSIKEP